MSSSNDDEQQNFIVGFVLALIALVLFLVIGIAIRQVHGKGGAQPPVAAAMAAIPEGASVRIENGIVKFYFASGSAEVAAGADAALAEVVKGVAAGRKAIVSGFHDTTGDAATNEALAKRRAENVQQALLGLGVTADKVDLQKPAVSTGSGSNAQARRVEVKLAD